ncbi:MAG: Holliday junction branch migration protein RuvA [Patescibacteria group bacterium]
MIGRLQGMVAGKNNRTITLDVHGVGYLVALTTDALIKIKLNQPLTLHTHLAVREDALDLFGFETAVELNYFQLLLTVPGIGPKSALAILSLAAPEVLQKAITAEDTAYLTRVSGIGKKSAEKIVLALKDKLMPATGQTDTGNLNKENLDNEAEAIEALKSLGYTLAEARTATRKAAADSAATVGHGVNNLIKAALRILSHH